MSGSLGLPSKVKSGVWEEDWIVVAFANLKEIFHRADMENLENHSGREMLRMRTKENKENKENPVEKEGNNRSSG